MIHRFQALLSLSTCAATPGNAEALWGYSGVPTKGFAASLLLLRCGWCERVDFYGQPGVPERFKSTQQGGFEGGKAGGFGYHGRGAGGVTRNTTDEAAAAETAAEEEAGPMGMGLTRVVPGRTARDVELGRDRWIVLANFIVGYRLIQDTRVEHAFDDVVSTIHQSLEVGAALQQERHAMHLMQALGKTCFYE